MTEFKCWPAMGTEATDGTGRAAWVTWLRKSAAHLCLDDANDVATLAQQLLDLTGRVPWE